MVSLDATLQLIWQIYWPSLAVVGAFAVLEWRWPIESRQPWRATAFNLVWHALFLVVFFALSWSAWGSFVAWLMQAGANPLFGRAASPAAEWARIGLALVVHDMLVYWGHRLMHAVPVLWAFHRLHHDEQHVNASTSLRQHWLTIPVHQMVVFMPLTWLFGVAATPELVYYALIVLGGLHHANWRIRFGPLTKWFVGPEYHRVHHAPPRAVHDRNFAPLFPIWDRLFGTQQLPDGFAPTGLADSAPTSRQWRVLAMPFDQWLRAVRVK